MKKGDTKVLLEQVYDKVEKVTGSKVTNPLQFRRLIIDDNAWNTYISSLEEGLAEHLVPGFRQLSENYRVQFLESANNMSAFNPYETLYVPILRKFYPRTIATQLVNTIPMDKPTIVKYFLKGKFKKYGQSTYPDNQTFPVMSADMSRGPSYGYTSTATSTRTGSNPGVATDVLTAMGLDTSNAHIEKDFVISGIADSTSTSEVTIVPDIDGNFSASVTTFGGDADVVSGRIDYDSGILTWSSKTDAVVSVTYKAYASLEENEITTATKLEFEKIHINAVGRQLLAEWTLPFEQDVRALFQTDVQSQIVNIMGEQIALDIDREIINDLISQNSTQNDTDHTASFDINPSATYTFTKSQWYHDVLIPINNLAARVYDDSQMGTANILACNPIDAAIFETLNTFRYEGDSYQGGDLGYATGSLQGRKYTILVSSVVPVNNVVMVYRSNDEARAVYAYCPYIPLTLTPYPMSTVPSVTIMARYGVKCLRPEGIACLQITDTSS